MKEILSVSTTLFLLMDPFGNLPIFTSILKSFSNRKQILIVIREMLIALIIMITFLFTGKYIFSFLGLRIESISISGSIILFLISISMMFPDLNNTTCSNINKIYKEPFILPLATPLVAGPSVLSNIIVLSEKYNYQLNRLLLSLIISWFFATLILISSNIFFRLIGNKGMEALEKFMGLVLIIISVQMFLDGMNNYILLLNTIKI